jgi:ribosomal protein S19
LPDEIRQFMRQTEHHMEVGGKCCRQHLRAYVLFPNMWSSTLAIHTEGHVLDFETT